MLNFINIILFGLYLVVTILFLREFVDPVEFVKDNYNGKRRIDIRRGYIVKKYLPFYYN